jgi:type IV pilus assembly protein PilP
MKTTFKTLLKPIRSRTAAAFSLIFCCSVLLLPSGSFSAVAPAARMPDTTSQKANPPESKPFVYEMANRPDPFMPFITEKTTDQGTEDPNEIVEKKETLTGMQIFEPGQLSLVALLNTEGQKYAMVQDFTGKGYVITEGTKIGKRGVVKTIESNKVLIEETAETRAGKKIVTYIDMVLKKEGEK